MATKAENKEVAEYKALTDIDLLSITDASSAVAAMRAAYGDLQPVNKFQLIKDKDGLLGKSFAVLRFDFVVDADTGREYVNLKCVTPQGDFFSFNDGSTGVYDQCKAYRDRTGNLGGINAIGGLRKSIYTKEIDGKMEKATTYYLD